MKPTTFPSKLRNLRRRFWIAKVNWEFETDKTIIAIETDVKELRELYLQYCNDSLSLKSDLFGRYTDIHFLAGFRKKVIDLINSGKDGYIMSSGDYNGIALSFKDMKTCIKLSREATKKDIEREERKRKRELRAGKSHARNIDSLKKKDKTIHYHFKQDYSYRGLEDSFVGTVKLSQLVEIEQARNAEDWDVSDALIEEYFGKGAISYSITELFGEHNQKLVKKLAANKTVSSADEIGFGAFASTAKKAKKAIQTLVLQCNDL